MEEFVGKCQKCGKEIYCENGFLNGVTSEGNLYCFQCSEGKFADKEDSR
ncbi:hypothetical protein [Sediminibacillus massiliensis]|nr:hypothetical protein [Sediminibacillus massiliensis]